MDSRSLKPFRKEFWHSVRVSVGCSDKGLIRNSVGGPIWNSVWGSVRNSVMGSVWDSVGKFVEEELRNGQ